MYKFFLELGLDWIVGPEYSFGVFSMSGFAPAALSSVELVVRIKHYKKKNAPFISKLVKTKRCKQTDATLEKLVVTSFDPKNVTSLRGGSL